MIIDKKNNNISKIIKNIPLVNEKIENINGWFLKQDICLFDFFLLLQNIFNVNGNLLEIGIWEGKSLFKILNYCKNNETLFGLDVKLKLSTLKSHYSNFDNTDRLALIEDSSDNIIKHSEINNIRFCHIDGCHRGDIVYNDIVNVNHYSNDFTILILDDFAKDYIGVMQAYYKAYFLNKTNFVPLLFSNRKCYFCHKKQYLAYYNYIKNNLFNFIINNYKNNCDIRTVVEDTNTNINNMLYVLEYPQVEDDNYLINKKHILGSY